MEEKNCKLLFEYLRDILYDPKVKTLDVNELDEPYQKLGLGLNYLERAVKEMKAYSAALSKGDLSGFTPSRENFLCENLKSIHANLNHLTWQAKQVAKGDYSQTVSYLGEFSEAFNTMTKQLREREMILERKAEAEKRHAEMAESYNQLLMELIARSEEEILVTSLDGQEVFYCNRAVDVKKRGIYRICMEQTARIADGEHGQLESYEWDWEAEDSEDRFYRITTGMMKWQGRKAYTHIIQEVTETRRREEQLKVDAHHDKLTGGGNRFFFQEKADELLATGERLIFCYCDLDHLKYVNDTFGHSEGDWYIRHFAETVQDYIRKGDVFARIGGDEFCIILRNCPVSIARDKVHRVQHEFSSDCGKPYAMSFSCGIVEVPKAHEETSSETILEEADRIMYQQKREHKKIYQEEMGSTPEKG